MRVHDLHHPTPDRDPLRSPLNFEDPMSAVGQAAQDAGERIHVESVAKPRLSFANLFRAWFGISDDDEVQPQGTPEEMWTLGFAIREEYTAQQEAIANLENITAATNTTQAWVSDLDDMATVPRALVSTTTIVNSTTKPKFKDILEIDSTVGYLHHGVTPVVKPVAPKGSTVGDIYYTPIVVDRVGTIEKVRWIAGADSSVFSIDYYEIALCVYNPANGNIEKVWGSGNIKDAEANVGSISAPPDEVAITMMIDGAPIDQQCAPGQILFVAHQQTAPGLLQTARSVAAVPVPPISRTVPLLDAWCYVAQSYSQGIPSSISMASLMRLNVCVPWMSVSVKALEPVTPPEDPEDPEEGGGE